MVLVFIADVFVVITSVVVEVTVVVTDLVLVTVFGVFVVLAALFVGASMSSEVTFVKKSVIGSADPSFVVRWDRFQLVSTVLRNE